MTNNNEKTINTENQDVINMTVEYFRDIEDLWSSYFRTIHDETLIGIDIKMDNASFPRNIKFSFITDKNVFSSIYYPPQFNIVKEHVNYAPPSEQQTEDVVEVISERDPLYANRKCISYHELDDEQIMEIGAYIEEYGHKAAKNKYNIHYVTSSKILSEYKSRLNEKEDSTVVPVETAISKSTLPNITAEVESGIIEDTINGDSIDKVSKKYKVSIDDVQKVIVYHWQFIENRKRIKKGKLVDKRLDEFKNQGSEKKPEEVVSNSGNSIADHIGDAGMSVIDEFFSQDKK